MIFIYLDVYVYDGLLVNIHNFPGHIYCTLPSSVVLREVPLFPHGRVF